MPAVSQLKKKTGSWEEMNMRERTLALLLALALLTGMMPVRVKAAETQKLAAITFDDGPGPYTDSLLDGLAKRNVPVTFFMVGYRAARYPGIVKKAYEAGHQIASHTYDHPSLTKTGDRAIQKQISATASILNQAVGGTHSYMVRPPYGNADARVLKALNAPAVLWSVDTLDWKSRNADAVYQHIVNDARDGSIILLHDIHATSIPGALRGIDALLSQGYELVTVSELLRRRGKEAVPGTKYFSAYGTSTLPGISSPSITSSGTENGRMVTLTADTGAKIYYTTDGTAPTSKSTVYTGPFPLEGAATVKAFAALDLNGARSQVSALTLEEAQARTPDITLQNGLIALSGKGEIHYTLDGSAPTADSPRYTGPMAIPGNTVIRAAVIQSGGRSSPVRSLTYTESGNLFSDIRPDAWYYHAADGAVSRGWMPAEGTAFFPERVVTRREAAEVVHRMAGRPKASAAVSGPDLKETDPAYAALAWAVEQRLLTPYADGTIRPNTPITREQLAALLFRTFGGTSQPAHSMLYMFLDWETVESDHREAMDWAVSGGLFDGLLNGLSDAMLFPHRAVTRGQLASVVMRCQENGQPAS